MKNVKFRVGQKVKIIDCSFCYWRAGRRCIGRTGKIIKITRRGWDSSKIYYLDIKPPHANWWKESELQPLKPSKKKMEPKVGDTVEIVRCNKNRGFVGKIEGISSDDVPYKVNGWWHSEGCISLIKPKKIEKKINKPVKEEEKTYEGFNLNVVENGYQVTPYYQATNIQFVFNTKARMIKWIEKHI